MKINSIHGINTILEILYNNDAVGLRDRAMPYLRVVNALSTIRSY